MLHRCSDNHEYCITVTCPDQWRQQGGGGGGGQSTQSTIGIDFYIRGNWMRKSRQGDEIF